MKAIQEQQQPNSMESTDSVTGSNEYAYRPLTTKHRRAGSTGTTGDEEYTTDEDELYHDETDAACSVHSNHHPIHKSDLARAATDLFGYVAKNYDGEDEPTSLFDEDERDVNKSHSPSKIVSRLNTTERSTKSCSSRESSPTPNPEKFEGILEAQKCYTRPLDLRLSQETTLAKQTTGSSALDAKDESRNQRHWRKTNSTQENGQESQSPTPNSNTTSSNSSPPSPTTLQWGRAVAEVKEHAVAKLQEELKRAHEELKLKDEEVSRLTRIRQDVETELEELTASLFQEAHNMVREANVRQATAERLLEESRMKSEVLAAEVSALKTLVLTSTPAKPNPHLHPQIDSRNLELSSLQTQQQQQQPQGLFTRKHRRSPSHFNLKYGRENSPPTSPFKEQRQSLPNDRAGELFDRDYANSWAAGDNRDRDNDLRDKETREFGLEVDPRVHAEFLKWKSNPCVDKSDPFVARIFREDIDLCLDFPNADLGSKVRQAVLDGIIFIEAVSDKAKLAFPKKCALLEAQRQCHYRMRLSDQENHWHSISQNCRNRIIAVCDFLNYLRYVERGLVKSSVHDIYWEITRLRKEMVFARLGLALLS